MLDDEILVEVSMVMLDKALVDDELVIVGVVLVVVVDSGEAIYGVELLVDVLSKEDTALLDDAPVEVGGSIEDELLVDETLAVEEVLVVVVDEALLLDALVPVEVLLDDGLLLVEVLVDFAG